MSDIALLGFKVVTTDLLKGRKALQQFAAEGRRTEQQLGKSAKSIGASLTMTAGVVGILALAMAGLTRELAEQSDAWKGVNSQIRQVTGSEKELLTVRDQLFDLSKKTRSDLKGTVQLFAEMKRGTDDLGLSNNRLLGVTQTLNNLFVAGGKPISETAGAIRQLNQGFAAGALRGDEFNSVAEGAPKVLDALQKQLGKTRGELREFAATGGITAEMLVLALEDYSEEAQKLADQTEKTFGQGMQNAATNMTRLIGESTVLNSALGTLGQGFEDVTEFMVDFSQSGQMAAAIDIIGTRINVLTQDLQKEFLNALEFVNELFSISTDLWGEEISGFGEFMKGAFTNLPENIRAIMQLIGVELAAFGELASIHGSTFGKILGIKFGEMIDSTKINMDTFGQIIGTKFSEIGEQASALGSVMWDSMNPFSEGNVTFESEMKKIEALTIDVTDEILANQEKQLAGLVSSSAKATDAVIKEAMREHEEKTQLRRDSIEIILEERTAGIKSAQDQIDKYDELGKKFAELKKNRLDAVGEGAGGGFNKKDNKATDKQIKDLAKLTKQVDKFGGTWSKTGSIIVDTFGDIADSLADYTDRISEIGKLEKELDKQREIHGKDHADVIAIETRLSEEKVNAELAGMSSIASAGQKLFDEKTAASKAFAALQKIITVAEIALSFQKIAASNTETGVTVANEGTKASASGLSAITAAFAAPWPIGFVAGAAMIAIIGSLLGGSSGGGGGGGGQTNQDTQGTGTIAGDPSAKSASISSTEKRFEELQIDQLAELRKIKFSVDALSLGIERLTGTIVTGGGVGDFQGELGETKGRSSLLGIKRLFNKTTKKIIDSGISFVSQSLGGIIEGGILEAQSFFDILTKKKRFLGLSSSSSTSREFQDIDIEIQQQMASIFGHIGTSVLEAAASLGFETVEVVREVFNFETMADAMASGEPIDLSGDFRDLFGTTLETVEIGLEEALNSFEVDIGEISLDGLSSEEIQAELEAVFSQQADLIAEFLVPSLAEYQQLGEGMFETLLRVAQEQAVFNDAIAQMGFDLSDLSNIMQIDIAQSLIGLTGGLENFSDVTQTFFEEFFSEAEQFAVLEQSISEAFDSLGLSVSGSKDEFRALIAGIDLTTEEGQELLAALLLISPALADYLNELEAIEEQRTEMTIELLRLQGDAEQALAMEREIELAAMDESLRSLQELIFAEQDRIALIKEQTRAINDSFSMLEQAVDLERDRAELALEAAEIAHEAEINRIDNLRENLNAELTLRQEHLASAESALNDAFNSEMTRIQESANAKISDIKAGMTAETAAIKATSTARSKALGEEKSALTSTASAMKSLVKTINQSLGIDGQLDLVGALAGARGGDFAKAQKLNVGSLANLDPANFASAQEMAIQQAINRGRLATISELAGDKLSETESLLSAMTGQTEAAKAASQSQIDAIKGRGNAQIDAIKERAEIDRAALQSQLDGLLGVDNTVLSIGDAITAFQAAQLSLDELNYDQEIAILKMLEQNAIEVLALHQQAYLDEIERLDAIISDNQALLNAALGIDNSVLSVADAINALNESIEAFTIKDNVETPITGPIKDFDPTTPPINPDTPPIIPDLPFDPPVVAAVTDTQLELASIREELADQLEQNSQYQQIMIRNSTTSARALQQFKYDGIDTRPIT